MNLSGSGIISVLYKLFENLFTARITRHDTLQPLCELLFLAKWDSVGAILNRLLNKNIIPMVVIPITC